MLLSQPEVYRACIRNVNALKRECEVMGMPLMVEPLVMQDNAKGGYMVDGNIDLILPLVRQAAAEDEAGAVDQTREVRWHHGGGASRADEGPEEQERGEPRGAQPGQEGVHGMRGD